MSDMSQNGELMEELLDEAGRWFTLMAMHPRAAGDVAAFRRWLAADPRHAAAMRAVEQAWREAGAARDESSILAERARAVRLAKQPSRGLGALRLRPSFAVLALLLLLGGGLAWQDVAQPATIYRSPTAERMDVALRDGSRVRLDAGSELRVTYRWFARQIELAEGQAEFTVAHDRLRPFTVATDRVVVRALGTVFAVRRGEEGSSVVLESGSVELRDPAGQTAHSVLKPGQKASYDGDAVLPQIRSVNLSDELAWRQGQVVFDRMPLGRAVRTLAKYAAAQVSVPAELEALPVSGIFRAGDVAGFLNAMSRINPIAWAAAPDGTYRITRKENK